MPEPQPERHGANLARPAPPAPAGFSPRTPCPTALLLHTLPGGDSHFDWLLAIEPAGAEPLITFRMEQRVDELLDTDNCAALNATSIGRHRAAYLTCEGPVSGNRGAVSRVRRGVIDSWTIVEPGDWRMSVHWEDSEGDDGRPERAQNLRLRAIGAGMMQWKVSIADSG